MKSSSAFWHPFADMSKVSVNQFRIERGEGVWVFDSEGRRYLDATSSLWYMNVGHGRQEIIDAISEQARQLAAYSTFGDFTNAPAEQLAHMLSERAPMEDAKVFFVSGGGDAIETAAKLSRLYFHVLGQPEKRHIITRTHSYHGTHGFGTSMGGISQNNAGYGDLVPEMERVSENDAEALEATIMRIGPGRVAAFFVEPVIGAGGVIPPSAGYMEAAYHVCKRHNVLFVVDAVICGFGRLGTWFGAERFDITPDLITFAKGVTSGYVPLGGVMISGEVAEPFYKQGAPVFRHGPTYAGHPLACAAGVATVDLMEKEHLVIRGRILESGLYAALLPMEEHRIVTEVRGGLGLLGAVELSKEYLTTNPQGLSLLQSRLRDQGILTRPLISSVAVSPPLTIEPEEISLISEGFEEALSSMEDEL